MRFRVSCQLASPTTERVAGHLPRVPGLLSMELSLPPLVGFCLVDEHAVVLDARADRYWMLPSSAARSLERYCAGADLTDAEQAQIAELVETGVIGIDSGGDPLAPCSLPIAETSILDITASIKRSSLLAAWFSVTVASSRLRRKGLASSLKRLEEDRQHRRTVANYDWHAAAYAGLRMWLSPLDRCLPLSLALAARCASPEVKLVFGVKLNPFAAHAWVQRGTMVLNDEVHVVRQFTPVLVV
jgi:Transglutaminase-like superfamily